MCAKLSGGIIETMSALKRDLIKLLVDKGLVTREQLDHAYQIHARQGGSLSAILVSQGYASERDLMIFLSTYLAIPPIKVLNLNLTPEVLQLIPRDIARKYMVLPLGKIGNSLTVAVSDPLNFVVMDDLEKSTGCEISPVLAPRSELQQALDTYYRESVTGAIEELIKDSNISSLEIIKEDREEEVQEEDILRSIDEAPVLKLTNHILKKAVEEKASDIFIEAMIDQSRVRYRLDGVLHVAHVFPREMFNSVVSRIKVIANLNITEHRLPQDGRFRLNIDGRDVDYRVSIMPSTMGEKVVLRILDKTAVNLDMDALGYEEDIKEKIKQDSLSSYGMLLFCGPTGSGKTTALYSILRHIYTPKKNIITVEEPIEYQLEGISQVNVNYEVGLTFASALRSILRQDPDVIMVGEMRDFETVDIGIKAALTGHLVLSTLHTTSSVGSVTRLVNMGVEPFLLASTLVGVMAQRLLRRLCPKCREINPLEDEIKERFKISRDAVVYKAKGCSYCNNQGYKGRVAITEYLHLDPVLRRMISENAGEHLLKREARARGLRTLHEDAIIKVEKGLTSLEEIMRVTSTDED